MRGAPHPGLLLTAALAFSMMSTAASAVDTHPPQNSSPADDPIIVRSKRLYPLAVDLERRIATALSSRSSKELNAIYMEAKPLVEDAEAVVTRDEPGSACDVAITSLTIVAGIFGNPETSLKVKQAWARSDGGYIAGSISNFMEACEDDLGIPRTSRAVGIGLMRSF
jgi:hypothetical protein